MTSTMKIFAVMGAMAAAFAFSPAARADHLVGTAGGNRDGGGGGGNHAELRPQPNHVFTNFSPSYSASAYSQGAYIAPNYQQAYYTAAVPLGLPTYYTPSIYAGAFVPPPIVFNPSFVAPNYFLPGDFYARSTYYVPAGVSPVVVLRPTPVTTFGAVMPMHPTGQPSQLTFTPMFQR